MARDERYIDEGNKRVLEYDGVIEGEDRTIFLSVKEIRFFDYSKRQSDRTFYDFGAQEYLNLIPVPMDNAEIVDRFGVIANRESVISVINYVGTHWLDYAKDHLKPIIYELEGKKFAGVLRAGQEISPLARDIGERNLMTHDEVLLKYELTAEQLADMTFSPYGGFPVFEVN